MVRESVDLLELLRKQAAGGDLDFLREAVAVLAEAVMEAEVAAQIGAGHGERSPERTTWRNGYRPRRWDTRAGSIELQIPKLRQGSYSRPCSSPDAAPSARCCRSSNRRTSRASRHAASTTSCARSAARASPRARCRASAPSSTASSRASSSGRSTAVRTATSGSTRSPSGVREEGRIAQVSPAGYPRVRGKGGRHCRQRRRQARGAGH